MKKINVNNKTFYLAGSALYSSINNAPGNMPCAVLVGGKWVGYGNRKQDMLKTPFGEKNSVELKMIAKMRAS